MRSLQPPIGDYALIGDTRTAALCSRAGSIDWMCVPRFDSSPIFSRLIDERGGSFIVTPADEVEVSRAYRSNSAVLETTWRSDSGVVKLTEGMVVEATGALVPQTMLVRRLRCERGSVSLSIRYSPAQGFQRQAPRTRHAHRVLICSWGALAVSLTSDPHVPLEPGREVVHGLTQGDDLTFVFTVADREPLVFVTPERAVELLDETDGWWKSWSNGLSLSEELHDVMVRSFITLRLLTYSPTAAPVAAPTTSLPERIGGSDNWDYRFSWPRDASIGLAAFLAVGRIEEAHAFMHWLLHASRLSRPRVHVLYDIYGRVTKDEYEADVSGYWNSRPVRIGNAAAAQHQLDVYGWLLDTTYVLAREQGTLHAETWRVVRDAADFVASHWREPDSGIWERRDRQRHYVHSKLMGWLALDRALRIQDILGRDAKRAERWTSQRDLLAQEIRTRGYNEVLNSYTDAYDAPDEVDAALLLLPVLEFDPPDSERVRGTIAAIRERLCVEGPLVYRFSERVGKEGVFLPCCFWLVQALARIGLNDEARELFEDLVARANDVGLFAEELDPETGEHLGNFPQAFTHAALLQAAMALGDHAHA